MPAGRPRIFKCPEDMEALIEDYFGANDEYTMAGLCNALGVMKSTLQDYEKRPEFSGLVKGARQRVEAYVESILLQGKNQTGAIFWLKNHGGYRDQQHHTVEAVNVELSKDEQGIL